MSSYTFQALKEKILTVLNLNLLTLYKLIIVINRTSHFKATKHIISKLHMLSKEM